MDGAAAVTTSELEGVAGTVCSACNLSNDRLAVCTSSGEVSTYTAIDHKTQWAPNSRWHLDQGAALQAAWAHPEFGVLLAILTDADAVTVWEEQPGTAAGMALQGRLSISNACTMAFAPKQYGLQLAVGSRDGRVRVYQAAVEAGGVEWVPQSDFEASSSACTAICWRPPSSGLPPLLLVGSEHGTQVFWYDGRLMTWQHAACLGEDPTADAGWASTAGGQAAEYVATASGNTARVWQLKGKADQLQVEELAALAHTGMVCRVSWNALGTWLATVVEDSTVHMWRPNLAGEWSLQSKIVAENDSEYVMVD